MKWYKTTPSEQIPPVNGNISYYLPLNIKFICGSITKMKNKYHLMLFSTTKERDNYVKTLSKEQNNNTRFFKLYHPIKIKPNKNWYVLK